MKAAVLTSLGAPLVYQDVLAPNLGTGEILVDVYAAPILPYANEVFSGARRYLLPTPVIPGCGAVGRVREVGPDSTQIAVGDWVFCDPIVRSRDSSLTPDITLQGWSARGKGGELLQRYFRDGAFAEQIRVPTECAVPLGEIESRHASLWCAISTLLVPYGGLLRINLQAGETVLVSGATGNFGSSAVATALAMGARSVIAVGRNKTVLADLRKRFGQRLVPVQLSGDEEADTEAMKKAVAWPIDAVFDILPPSVDAKVARAAIMSVRPYGRAVLMGGVGMLGGDDLALPYPWIMRNNVSVNGQWMYETSAVTGIVRLVRAGLLDLDNFEVTEFALRDVNRAVEHAASHGGPFKLTTVTMEHSR